MRKLVRTITRHAQDDLEMLNELTRNEVKREAEVPVLDGLFGGKPCARHDGSKYFLITLLWIIFFVLSRFGSIFNISNTAFIFTE